MQNVIIYIHKVKFPHKGQGLINVKVKSRSFKGEILLNQMRSF